MLKSITHVCVEADNGKAFKVVAYGERSKENPCGFERCVYGEDTIPQYILRFLDTCVISDYDRYDGVEHITYVPKDWAKERRLPYERYLFKTVEFWGVLGNYDRRQFEECMYDLHRDMSAWASEIYDREEFYDLTDDEMHRLEDAIERCAGLVETFAKMYGIEV